jgi:hypothetical protein
VTENPLWARAREYWWRDRDSNLIGLAGDSGRRDRSSTPGVATVCMNGTNAKRCVPSTHYTVTTCSGESTYTVPWPMPPCIMHGRVREHQCRSITVSDRLTTGPFLPRVPAHSSLVCHPPAYGVRRTPPSDPCVVIPTGQGLGPCLDPKFHPKFHYAKRRFSVTSKCRHIYRVLNVDEIKN